MAPTGSVAGRAALAVGLMIGFYVLALAIAGFLLSIPIAELQLAHRIHPKLALICLVGAGTILWSILPRWDKFPAPGPTLEASSHPRLFAEIEAVARETGQTTPSEVFLVGDVNAWVAQRGGVMGFFSRRVMGLGLPLLQVLTVSELRAVLAHEFGHYHGGDTRLGPWVYKTRAAIGRTISGLGDSMLQAPFRWYGELFLRISHAVSRRQEFSADALASRVVGARPLVEGLKKVQVAAPAFGAYWSQEVAPVLQAGFLPPIGDGFRRFASESRVSASMDQILDRVMKEAKTEPYDTHPPLPDRIQAVRGLPDGPDPAGEPLAITLLSDVSTLEQRWLASVADPAMVDRLKRVDWDAAFTAAVLPSWRQSVDRSAAVLGNATLADLPIVVAEASSRASHLDDRTRSLETLDGRTNAVRWLAAASATLALARAGWTIDAPPGATVRACRDGAEIRPFDAVAGLADGTMTAEAWRGQVDRFGVAALPLVEEPRGS